MKLKMPKFGVLVRADRFSVVSVSFFVSRDSLRELHVFLPFVTFGTLRSREKFDRYIRR